MLDSLEGLDTVAAMPPSNSAYESKYGIVCLIDALGAKNYNDEETKNFLHSRHSIREAMEEKGDRQVDLRGIERPQIAFFNDTVVIAIECEEDSKQERDSIFAMAVIVRRMIADGIAKGIFFRGAIGVGKFIADLPHSTIIGQAVSDAASWYESTNFIGCVLTPRLEYVWRKHVLRSPPVRCFIRYPVSTKDGEIEMECVDWPLAFYFGERPEGCEAGKELSFLYKKFGESSFPKAAADKFSNSEKFFHASRKKNTPPQETKSTTR